MKKGVKKERLFLIILLVVICLSSLSYVYTINGFGIFDFVIQHAGSGITQVESNVSINVTNETVALINEPIQAPKDVCPRIYGNSAPSKSMNIFFVGAGYQENQIRSSDIVIPNEKILESDIRRFLYSTAYIQGYGILTIEPFKANLDWINVYMLAIPLNYNYTADPFGYYQAIELVLQKCGVYKSKDPIYVIIGWDDPATYSMGGGGQLVSASHRKRVGPHDYEDTVSTFIHEIGHNFMLHDNYGVAYYPYNPPIMIDSYYIPNCDNNAGCPKWCNGNPTPPFEMDCANYSNEEECNEHSQTQDCLWLDHEDPYFQVRCIKNTDPQNHNIGTDCMEDTGCYWGCSGAGYRPGEDNNFANRFTQRIDILSRKHTYDPVSERFVQDIFDCCYPGNCSNYNYTYCSDFSERYWEYGMCNTCEGETAGVSNPPTINTNTNTQSGLFGWFKSIFG